MPGSYNKDRDFVECRVPALSLLTGVTQDPGACSLTTFFCRFLRQSPRSAVPDLRRVLCVRPLASVVVLSRMLPIDTQRTYALKTDAYGFVLCARRPEHDDGVTDLGRIGSRPAAAADSELRISPEQVSSFILLASVGCTASV